MIEQAQDFREESRALTRLLYAQPFSAYREPTQFKGWTYMDVLQHLHFWNCMAYYQLTDPDKLLWHLQEMKAAGGWMRAYESSLLSHMSEGALLTEYVSWTEWTADLFAEADPKARLVWAGPEMSARSSITARLMETWAHGQEIYDHAGVARVNEDRIGNIVMLGVNTFGWTYKTRKETPPGPLPHLVLTAPSGAIWTYGEPSETDRIEGLADEFCQVVTQTRNIADTDLKVTGRVAADWMSKAQCFAGPPSPPPAPGVRHVRKVSAA